MPEALRSDSKPPHDRFWPVGVPRSITVPDESLWRAFEGRALATPEAVGLNFLGRTWTWGQMHAEALDLAGALAGLGVRHGDRVVLFAQNCPQFIVALHAILRLGAVVVPVNPMNKADELVHYLQDAGPAVAIASSDIAPELSRASVQPGAGGHLRHLVVFDLADALPQDAAARSAQWPAAWAGWLMTRHPLQSARGLQVQRWEEALARHERPPEVPVHGDDLALLPYTSGTTGLAKGCLHTHATLLHNVIANGLWLDMRAGDSTLIVVPMFHITGLVVALLSSIRAGATLVLLPRWDSRQAAEVIQQLRVTHWPNIPTMVIDLLGNTSLRQHDLSSLRYIGGGGAAMPDAVGAELQARYGLSYVEGYGLTETAAPTHTNPCHAPKRHCLGIPFVGTKAIIVDPGTLAMMPTGEAGEILVNGPQVFKGYWRQPEATRNAFVDIDGVNWFRTGDLGRVDGDGYFTIADRLKRMINASGFKVWPAEVEAMLHRHPAVQEVCIIASRDAYRGETVKAVIVPRDAHRDSVKAKDIMDWCREHMAVYKVPRQVEFVQALPRSASGKMLWRVLQAEQDARDSGP